MPAQTSPPTEPPARLRWLRGPAPLHPPRAQWCRQGRREAQAASGRFVPREPRARAEGGVAARARSAQHPRQGPPPAPYARAPGGAGPRHRPPRSTSELPRKSRRILRAEPRPAGALRGAPAARPASAPSSAARPSAPAAGVLLGGGRDSAAAPTAERRGPTRQPGAAGQDPRPVGKPIAPAASLAHRGAEPNAPDLAPPAAAERGSGRDSATSRFVPRPPFHKTPSGVHVPLQAKNWPLR